MSDDSQVREQYEAYPYPERDPQDEARRLVTGSPSHLLEVNHYVFGGRRDFGRPFRALVAGGGTGDAAIMLAQQLTDAGDAGEVVYVDASEAARRIAEQPAAARKLANIRFETLSLLDLPTANLGEFDYIDCCGVLHHLEYPPAGLRALTSVLAADGGMGLMLYGALGRTGVYPLQELLGKLTSTDAVKDRISIARRMLKSLPETNWLRRNPFVSDHLEAGDAGLYDLLLHSRDRAYRVPEIVGLAEDAGMAITALVEPARYNPASYIKDGQLLSRLEQLDWLDRAAAAEQIVGNLSTHVFYVVAQDRAEEAVARPVPEAIPHLRNLDGSAFAKSFKPGSAMTAEIDGYSFRCPLPPLGGAIVSRIDGNAGIREIHERLKGTISDLEWDIFDRQFRELFNALNGLGKLYLSMPTG